MGLGAVESGESNNLVGHTSSGSSTGAICIRSGGLIFSVLGAVSLAATGGFAFASVTHSYANDGNPDGMYGGMIAGVISMGVMTVCYCGCALVPLCFCDD